MNWNMEPQVGDVVEIESGSPISPLPIGLTPGFQVRIIRIDAGCRVVEREGREWRLNRSQIRPRCQNRFLAKGVSRRG